MCRIVRGYLVAECPWVICLGLDKLQKTIDVKALNIKMCGFKLGFVNEQDVIRFIFLNPIFTFLARQIMNNNTIAVVGATGKTGVRVLAQLADRGYKTRGLSRNSEITFDWSDRSTWEAALTGVNSVYVTYYPDLAVPQAEDDMHAFVAVAKKVGVNHLVLLSGRGEKGAQRAEDVVKASGIEWNIVRASWFMQNFSESFMLDGLKAGQLVLPRAKSERTVY